LQNSAECGENGFGADFAFIGSMQVSHGCSGIGLGWAFLAAVSLGIGCTSSEVAAVTSDISIAKEPSRGVYAFDGTNTDASSNNAIYRFYTDAKTSRKGYFAGTNLPATTYAALVEKAATTICAEHKRKPFAELYLVGYSRGAVAALEVATLVAKCGVPVRWLGLVDAVATSIADSLSRGNRGRTPTTTRCVHLVKSTDDGDYLRTAEVSECPTLATVAGNHVQVAGTEQAATELQNDAARVAPALFDFDLELSAADKSCRFDTQASCKKNTLCVWDNALCEPK
jgi:hypothetical protein